VSELALAPAATAAAPTKRAKAAGFATDAERWAAVVRRDPVADGVFYYSVRTTGVYCRPSCPARLARRENVRFHATGAEAQAAGFRPCKRCRPNGQALDWPRIAEDLDTHGYAVIGGVLSRKECAALVRSYTNDEKFRSRVVMARHGFGRGEYKYFAYPLPELVVRLRATLYPPLAEIANRWHAAMGIDARFPETHAEFLERCWEAGQAKPTPLILQYAEGDYNCLHQDLYGAHIFPLQAAFLLSEPERDFRGGEFVLTEQRPRRQSRAEVVPLHQGDGVIFPVRHRPVQGTRGTYRVNMRHGVSRIRSGRRHTLGVIFHDAQ